MSKSSSYRSEIWGEKRYPTEKDLSNQFRKRPGHPFEEGEKNRFEGLKEFWKEYTALSNPIEYAAIGRNVLEQENFADTVVIYYPGDRHEIYSLEDEPGESLDLSLIDEENHQHGFVTYQMPYKRVESDIQEIIELEDDLSWRVWDGNI